MRRVAVYCGSRAGRSPVYGEAVARLADALAERGLGVVYGGGRVGLMGRLADEALARGLEVIGVVPRAVVDVEKPHEGLAELHLVESMHGRKLVMTVLCDAFVALPGGHGTMDELFEAMTWRQLGIHEKPVGLLDVEGYFAPLREQLRRFVEEGFVDEEVHALLCIDDDPARLLDRLRAAREAVGR